jgi:hypothetical protein
MGISPSIQSSKCPYCGREMTEGFIVAAGGRFMFWLEDADVRFWSIESSNARLLESHLSGIKCDACELVILDIRDPIEVKYADVPRTKCPHCKAIYLLREDMVDENNIITCQNCARLYKQKSVTRHIQNE